MQEDQKVSTSINQETRVLFQEYTETAIEAIAEIASEKLIEID